MFLIKNNEVTKVAERIISEESFPIPKLMVFNPAKNEYQIITTYEYGPSNTKADVYRMQKGKLVKIFGVMGDQGVRISKSVIYQDWKKYRNEGGWDKVIAVYSWDNKKQKFIASSVKP